MQDQNRFFESEDHTMEFDTQDAQDAKIWSVLAYFGILWYAIRSKGGERPCQLKHTIICPDCLNFTSFTAHSCRYTAKIVTGFMTGVRLGPFTAHRRTASGEADERVSVSAAHAKRWLWHRSTAFPRG